MYLFIICGLIGPSKSRTASETMDSNDLEQCEKIDKFSAAAAPLFIGLLLSFSRCTYRPARRSVSRRSIIELLSADSCQRAQYVAQSAYAARLYCTNSPASLDSLRGWRLIMLTSSLSSVTHRTCIRAPVAKRGCNEPRRA